MTTETLRQLLYTSLCTPGADIDAILHQSRHNNAVDGITGLLWYRDDRFLQILEGPASSVTAVYDRIAADSRHHTLTILSDRTVAGREFGYWSMERGSDHRDERLRERLVRRLRDAPDDIRAAFVRQD